MKSIFITALLILSASHSIYARVTSHRELIILIDRSYEENAHDILKLTSEETHQTLGAITYTLLPALYQQAAPILVSTSLVANVLALREIFQDFAQESITFLRKKYGHQRRFAKPGALRTFKEQCRYASLILKEVNKEIRMLSKHSENDISTFLDALTTKPEYLEEAAPESLRFYKMQSAKNERYHHQLQVFALCAFAPLDTTHYYIKQVSHDLVLLMPKSYLAKITDQIPSYKEKLTSLTDMEKQCGLQLQHFPDVELSRLSSHATKSPSTPLPTVCEKLFVAQKQAPGLHTWFIYLAGHGLPAFRERSFIQQLAHLEKLYAKPADETATSLLSHSSKSIRSRASHIHSMYEHTHKMLKGLPKNFEHIICSLPMEEFKDVLTFFNTQISTTVLFYTSCFAGGEHLLLPYQHKGTDVILNYDVMVSSITDAISRQEAPMMLIPPYYSAFEDGTIVIKGITEDSFDLTNKRLGLHTSLRFHEFFKSIKASEKNYATCAGFLHPYINSDNKLIASNLDSVAFLRPAHHAHFSPLQNASKNHAPFAVFSAEKGVTAADTYDAVLLATHHTKKVKLGESMPVLSLLPATAWHVIDEIQASSVAYTRIFRNFLALPSLSSTKLFWIQHLSCSSGMHFAGHTRAQELKDVIITRNTCTSDNIMKGKTTGIYFTDSAGICWHGVFDQGFFKKTRTDRSVVRAELFALFGDIQNMVSA